MRLFLYYSLHTFKNGLKKLFKTWIAVFIVCCLVFGVIIGGGVSWIVSMAEKQNVEQTETDNPSEIVEKESVAFDFNSNGKFDESDEAKVRGLAELAAFAVALLVFLWNLLSGEKSGSSIFQLTDVNLLFSAPLKPQSVLLFRIMTQFGTMLLASLYLLFQLPNLVGGIGMSIGAALILFLTWFVILAYGKLVSVLVYTVSSTHIGLKKYIRPFVIAIVVFICGGYLTYRKAVGGSILDTALGFFNAPATGYIPILGWIKRLPVYAFEDNWQLVWLCVGGLVVGIAVLTFIIWNIKADFYEDAMAKSSETAELVRATQEGNVAKHKGKDRSEKLKRDGLSHGYGANVFFWKAIYNRFRFAHFGLLTKTTETYLVVAVGGAITLRFYFHYESIAVIAFLLGGIAFFRSIGNPISQDTQLDSFMIIPESAHAKVFYSLLGGTVNCLFDILPGLVIAAVILRANALLTLLLLLLIMSVDFYSSNVGVFIDLSVPVSAGKTLKTLVQILFIYFGLLPIIGIIAVGTVMKWQLLAIVLAVLFNVIIGSIFFLVSPLFISNGRK